MGTPRSWRGNDGTWVRRARGVGMTIGRYVALAAIGRYAALTARQ
ncbi:hypothetical protein [Lysobacter gummosus]